jgi:hypothetical protein
LFDFTAALLSLVFSCDGARPPVSNMQVSTMDAANSGVLSALPSNPDDIAEVRMVEDLIDKRVGFGKPCHGIFKNPKTLAI